MIFGGYGRKAKQRGEVYFVCFECERLNVFGLVENYGYAQVYGVRLAKYKAEHFMACSHCQRGWDLEPEQWRHARRVAQVLDIQPNLTPRQLAQSALVLAEGAFPDLVPTVRGAIADELEGGLDAIFLALPEPADEVAVPAGLNFLRAAANEQPTGPSASDTIARKASTDPSQGAEPSSTSGGAERQIPNDSSDTPSDSSVPLVVGESLTPRVQGEDPVALPGDGASEEGTASVVEPDEMSDEEIETSRKALRYRLIEAVESTGWGVQLVGDDILLGAGRVHLQALPFERVLIYAPIEKPNFAQSDVNGVNAETQFAAFLASYETKANETMWAAFQRLSLPAGNFPAKELGRWLDPQIADVLAANRMFDDSADDDLG